VAKHHNRSTGCTVAAAAKWLGSEYGVFLTRGMAGGRQQFLVSGRILVHGGRNY